MEDWKLAFLAFAVTMLIAVVALGVISLLGTWV